MAKIRSPLFSFNANGSLSKTLTYRKKPKIHTVSKYAKPGDKVPFESSPRQKDQRSIIRLITIHWQCMSSSDKLSWETAAKENRFKGTGYHYFLHIAQTDLTKYLGLVGYWTFNYHVGELVYDLSNNKNHGTLKPSYPDNYPVFVDSINKKLGKALSFDGIDDYVDISDGPSLKITGDITVECWIKPNVFANEFLPIFYKDETREWAIAADVRSTNRLIRWSHGDGVREFLTFHNILVDGEIWYHITVVRTESPKEVSLYKNGVFVLTKPYTKTIISGTKFEGIGIYGGLRLNGLIDEVRVYKRVLPEEEIKKLYSI